MGVRIVFRVGASASFEDAAGSTPVSATIMSLSFSFLASLSTTGLDCARLPDIDVLLPTVMWIS
jgi:hypothetical protein